MAVFTELGEGDVERIADVYSLAQITSITGIVEGDTDTTYVLRAGGTASILTIFETDVDALDIERAFRTMDVLRHHDVPCPTPIRTRHGAASFVLRQKLAALVSFIDGNNSFDPNAAKCRQLGEAAARIHIALNANTSAKSRHCDPRRGWVHGALNRKNVMFTDDQVTGIINFRLRHSDFLVSEFAEIAVEWIRESGELFRERLIALFDGYNFVRPFSAAEIASIPLMVVSAAAKAAGAAPHEFDLKLDELRQSVVDILPSTDDIGTKHSR